jgi:hypothetical protein
MKTFRRMAASEERGGKDVGMGGKNKEGEESGCLSLSFSMRIHHCFRVRALWSCLSVDCLSNAGKLRCLAG